MPATLEPIVRELIGKFDAMDVDGILPMLSDDFQAPHSFEDYWMRTKDEARGYFGFLKTAARLVASRSAR